MNQFPTHDSTLTSCFRTAALALVILLSGALLTETAQAQTPVTKVKDSDENVLLQVNEDAGLLVNGDGTGSIPATGAGIRMMWYPDKAAFRAGQVGVESGKEDVWDADSVGAKSVAFGTDTRATGNHSTALGNRTHATGGAAVAMGLETEASGLHSLAIGNNTTAGGNNSFVIGNDTKTGDDAFNAAAFGTGTLARENHTVAMGVDSEALADRAVAMGSRTEASGSNAVSMGKATVAGAKMSVAMGNETEVSGWHSVAMNGNTTAQAKNSLVIGRWNTVSGDKTSWVQTDPLFVAGNGNGENDRSNALLLQKNGEMTIAGNLTENSDRRLKTDIQELGSVLDDLAEIDPVRFNFKKDTGHPEDRQIGLIAQEVQDQFPELVTKGSDGYLSLAYPKLTAVLLKGLQEQEETIDQLKTENTELRSGHEATREKVNKLEGRLARLKSRVETNQSVTAGLGQTWVFGGLLLAFLAGGIFGATFRFASDQ